MMSSKHYESKFTIQSMSRGMVSYTLWFSAMYLTSRPDHDYLTNDPSNPHFLRDEFRLAEIEAITGWDRNYFRFGPKHKGIERTWTQELQNLEGKPFLIRFIVLDEESTANATQGCAYYHDQSSPTGFVPRKEGNSSAPCPDIDILEDFEEQEPKRAFFGQSQLDWFKEQLLKPADLIFVLNGTYVSRPHYS